MTNTKAAWLILVMVLGGIALASIGQWVGGILILLWSAWLASGLKEEYMSCERCGGTESYNGSCLTCGKRLPI